MAALEVDLNNKPGFKLHKRVLVFKDRLFILTKSNLIPLLLQEFHSTSSEGHSGYLRTYRRIATNLYWIGMEKAMMDFVRACPIGQRMKSAAMLPSRLLQSLLIPDKIWEEISLDLN